LNDILNTEINNFKGKSVAFFGIWYVFSVEVWVVGRW